jgi:hypothetical protein
MRVIGYIDGLNFYHASKGKAWYPAGWCNWTETFSVYCPGAAVSVRYFTSRYPGGDQDSKQRQNLHLRAMSEVAKAEIIEGSIRQRVDRRCECGRGTRLVEKMTDVNIAIRLVEDAIDGLFDLAYVVSADVDLVPAIHAALRRSRGAQVFGLLPPESEMAEEYRRLEVFYGERSAAAYLDLAKMRRFPDDLPLRWGMTLPEHWREQAGRRPHRIQSSIGQVKKRFEKSAGGP